ncbi:hypothetical protein ACJJID_01560 [Microbulbifer sp. CnH-101-G]|uniref:hypothetical protein n=1 Tax=Microbulbifer sp. CnH-101-G TaxID=3243393 RepID=UPI0040394A2F
MNKIAQKLLNSRLFDPDYVKKIKHSDGEKLKEISCEDYCLDNELWRITTSGLFCGQFYLNRYPDVEGYAGPPAVHYLKYGFHEGRTPSPLVDIKFICEQYRIKNSQDMDGLDDHDFDLQILSQYSSLHEMLKELDISPNPLFDNAFFKEKYDCQDELPIIAYLRMMESRASSLLCLETTPIFSMSEYLKTFPDLVEAKVDPLCHLLEWGVSEGRLESAGLISEIFKKSALEGISKNQEFSTYSFLSYCAKNKTLASPKSESKYADSSLPCFSDSYQNGLEKCFVGVVLYKNSAEEILRFKTAMDKEVARSANLDVVVKYYVNDSENEEVYEKILGHTNLISSPEGNIGFGRGHNALMRSCFPSHDIYIGLNPDGYVLPGFLEAIINFNSYNNGRALIEAPTAPVDHPKWHDPITLDTYWVSGAAFAISREIWSEVGGFDSNIHMYCEDVDLSWRVKAAGFDLKVCPKAKFFHDVTPRFIPKNEQIEKGRTIKMLSGAYYLAMKWRGDQQAATLAQQLKELGINENDQVFSAEVRQVPNDWSTVTNFDNWLRYSPSRFWL